MNDNPDDAILKTIAKAGLGIILAPFIFLAFKIAELADWVVGKVRKKD